MFIYHIPQYGSFNYRRIFGHQYLLTHYTDELIALSLLKLRDTPPINIWGSDTLWFNYAVSSNGNHGWARTNNDRVKVCCVTVTLRGYIRYPFNLCIAPALADSNGLLYVIQYFLLKYVIPPKDFHLWEQGLGSCLQPLPTVFLFISILCDQLLIRLPCYFIFLYF